MAESTESASVLATIGVVLVAMIGLSVLDAFLARTERSENRAKAERLMADGRALMKRDRAADAVVQFKGALGIERENPRYLLALGQAELAAGQLAEAEATLTQLLGRDSTSGEANLALARVLEKEGRIPEAVSTYHRSIYGRWEGDAEKRRVEVRWELVGVLGRQGSKEELLAELLPLLDVALEDLSERKRLGNLFLIAGSAVRADEVFREMLRRHPQDADARFGLGRAEFLRGNYQTALNDFELASGLRPGDRDIEAELQLCAEVLGLDPMRRGIAPEEQYRRSSKMLEIAAAAVQRCGGVVPSDVADAMKEHARPGHVNEAMEENLSMAEQVWKLRQQTCKQAPSAEEEPLRLVLARIAQ